MSLEQQPDLFSQKVAAPLYDDGDTIQQRFEKFHAANPWVLSALVQLARRYKDMGRDRIGVKHLVEVLRWEVAKGTKGDDFKLNNNFTSRYVRAIAKGYPELASLFEYRVLKA
jgi:hypothetical protein